MSKKFVPIHWLLTLLFAPFVVTMLSSDIGLMDILDIGPVMIMMSVVLSLPVLAVSYFLALKLEHLGFKPILIQAISIVISLLGIVVSFRLLGGSQAVNLTIIYSVSAAVSGLALMTWFRLKRNSVYFDSN